MRKTHAIDIWQILEYPICGTYLDNPKRSTTGVTCKSCLMIIKNRAKKQRANISWDDDRKKGTDEGDDNYVNSYIEDCFYWFSQGLIER